MKCASFPCCVAGEGGSALLLSQRYVCQQIFRLAVAKGEGDLMQLVADAGSPDTLKKEQPFVDGAAAGMTGAEVKAPLDRAVDVPVVGDAVAEMPRTLRERI